ncbi:MAG: outer membrane protein transport protein [Flavobacteriaceae bacterium]|jgi:long-chain fatty acid transport protein|nr:outer membrane protein transport protein [Flavobacteriaceae bacterium]
MKLKFVFLSLLVSCGLVQAGGFRIAMQGVRQAAMAHTSAHTRDASVAFFNPAGISFIPNKLSVSFGGFAMFPTADYQDVTTLYKHSTDNPVGTPIYFGAAYKITDKLSAALSFTTPFGSSVDWGKHWAGQDLITKIELKAYYLQPTLAYRFNDWFSVGVGYIYALGDVLLEKNITSINGDIQLKKSGAVGHGFNVGMYFKPTDKLDVSVAYRSSVDIKATKGEANLNIPASLVGTANFPTDRDHFDATLPLASEFTFGVTYRITPKWLVSADWDVSGWERYKNLTFDFYQNPIGNDPNDPTISTSVKNYFSSNIFRLGTEYLATDRLALRLGGYYDQSPVRDKYWNPETPSTNNYALSAGLGYRFGKAFFVDLTGIYLSGQERDVKNEAYNFYGQTKLNSYMFGLGLTWNAF